MPTVSVVVPSYQGRKTLPRFLDRILSDPALTEVVVAVDGSTDGSIPYLEERRADEPRIVVLPLPNRGAGAARQAGIEASSGDVVLLMDDDVLARAGLAAGHGRHHVGLGPKLVAGYMPNRWDGLPPGRRGIARIYSEAYEENCENWSRDPRSVLHGLWGGNLSMPRRDFLRVGVEGLAVKRGQDDREFGLRCLRAGIDGVFDPSLRAEHAYDRNLAQFRRDMRLQGESRRMIHDAHPDLVGEGLVLDSSGPETADAVGRRVPRRLRRLLPILAEDPLFTPVTTLLTIIFKLGVELRLLPVEVFAARGIGSLETQRGVLDRASDAG